MKLLCKAFGHKFKLVAHSPVGRAWQCRRCHTLVAIPIVMEWSARRG